MNDIKSHSMMTTPIFSFTAKKDGVNIEADFAMLYKDQGYRGDIDGVIFGECKTFGSFKKIDVDRMGEIAQKFPGAILAFCKLDNKLSKEEVKLLTRLAVKGRKYHKNDMPINPVLILTGNELFSDAGMPHCWEGMNMNVSDYDFRNIVDLCNQTQRIYLGLPRWEEDWRKKWEKRGKNKLATSKIPKTV